MLVTVDIPDAIAAQLHLDGAERGRRALEMFALEGYRSGKLSRGQVSEMLGQSYHETEAFLKAHDCGLGLTFDDHETAVERVKKMLQR